MADNYTVQYQPKGDVSFKMAGSIQKISSRN